MKIPQINQNTVNLVVIIGIVVMIVGVWAGPMSYRADLSALTDDLQDIETDVDKVVAGQGAQLQADGLLDDMGDMGFTTSDWFDPTEFAIQGSLNFAPPPPQQQLTSAKQQLIPASLTGITVVAAGVNTFGPQKILAVMNAGADNFGAAVPLIDNFNPVLVDKIIVENESNIDKKLRIVVGWCVTANQFDPGGGALSGNEICDINDPNGNADNGYADIEFPFIDMIASIDAAGGDADTVTIVGNFGSPNPAPNTGIFAIIADNDATGGVSNDFTVWLGVQRQGGTSFQTFSNFGSSGAGGAAGFTCLVVRAFNPAGTALNDIAVDIHGLGSFFSAGPTNTATVGGQTGIVVFNNIPNDDYFVNMVGAGQPPSGFGIADINTSTTANTNAAATKNFVLKGVNVSVVNNEVGACDVTAGTVNPPAFFFGG